MSSSAGDPLEEIFARAASGQTLFKNREALRAEYIPNRLLFRDIQISTLGQVLAPVLHFSRCSNLLLYGKTGTGKTAVARYVVRRLIEKARAEGLRVSEAYCNTRVAGTEYRVLYEIGQSVRSGIPFTGLSLSEASDRILNRIVRDDLGMIVVLDEIDYLVKSFGDDRLYELTRINERLSRGFLSIIGISNDLQFKDYLDPRVLSSLSEEEVVFPPYTSEELQAILRERVAEAFYPNVVLQGALGLCAALAGSEHGDARRAVDLLRVSGEIAEREGARAVAESHVREAAQKIDQDRMVDALRSLPPHVKLVLLSVFTEQDSNTTGEVYDRYCKLCARLSMDSLTQRRVSGLLSELDLLGLVSADVISHGRHGRTKRIKPLVGFDVVKSIFREDPLLGPSI